MSYDMFTLSKVQTYSNITSDTRISYTVVEEGWYYLNAISSNSSYPIQLYMGNNNNMDWGFNVCVPAGNSDHWMLASTPPMFVKAGQTIYIVPCGSTVCLMRAGKL